MAGPLVEIGKFNRQDVDEILDTAKAMEFDSVVVMGVHKGAVTTLAAGDFDRLRMLGALEAAKQDVWNFCVKAEEV